MCVPFGNVTADTEFSFEYGVKKVDARKGKCTVSSLMEGVNIL